MRAIIMVIDGFGIGEMPDAKSFGDEGSNTYGNIKAKVQMDLSFLRLLGLDGILGEQSLSKGAYGKLSENAKAKDTTAGHWEMMGIQISKPFVTFPNGIPIKLIEKLESAWGRKTLCNGIASGTLVINEFGDEHIATGSPIVYTSADSVIQIACHTKVMSHEELYVLCEKARQVCTGEFEVGRIIARPFDGVSGNYERTPFRHDFSVVPPENVLNILQINGIKTVGVGKIFDIFAGNGITESYPLKGNVAQLQKTLELVKTQFDGLIFANFVDTDMLFGHRNDVIGYAKCLEEFDVWLGKIVGELKDDDILFVTGDHGNDPTTISTDHSREFTPLLICGKMVKQNVCFGTKNGFDTIGQTILDYFGIEKGKKSLIKEISK